MHTQKNGANLRSPSKIRSKLNKSKSKLFKLAMWLGTMVETRNYWSAALWTGTMYDPTGGKSRYCTSKCRFSGQPRTSSLQASLLTWTPKALTSILHSAMEEAQIKMVAKNPEQFGAITKPPSLHYQQTL
jgi:hypothetical protein